MISVLELHCSLWWAETRETLSISTHCRHCGATLSPYKHRWLSWALHCTCRTARRVTNYQTGENRTSTYNKHNKHIQPARATSWNMSTYRHSYLGLEEYIFTMSSHVAGTNITESRLCRPLAICWATSSGKCSIHSLAPPPSRCLTCLVFQK